MLLRVNTLIKTTAPEDIDINWRSTDDDYPVLVDLPDHWGCYSNDWERCRIGGTDPIQYERGSRLFMETK